MSAPVERARLTVDLPADLRRRLRLVAAHRDASIREYVLEAIEAQLRKDWAEVAAQEDLLALNARSDPLLAELWDNDKDAAYDQL